MDWKRYLVPAVGGVAFVIGGLITRSKTLDGIETLEKSLSKRHEPKPVPPSPAPID